MITAPVDIEDEDCDHERIEDIERDMGILFGVCADCDQTLQQTGVDDEDGIPGWEIAE